MKLEILHSHSVHADLGLISCRLRVETGSHTEDFQFYKLLKEVQENPLSLESFVESCKEKAITRTTGEKYVPSKLESKEESKKGITKTEVTPVKEEVEPKVETSVAIPEDTSTEPTLESVTAELNKWITTVYKTQKAFTTEFGAGARDKIASELFNNKQEVVVDNIQEVIASIKEAKEKLTAEKAEELLYKRPQPTEALTNVQKEFLKQAYLRVKPKFPDVSLTPPLLMEYLDKYHLPVKIATREGNKEYQPHPTLEAVVIGCFEKHKIELENCGLDF